MKNNTVQSIKSILAGGSEMVVDSKYGLGIMMNMNYRGGIKNLLNIKKSF